MLKSDWIKSQIIPDESREDLVIRLNELIEIDNPISDQPMISAPVDVNKLWNIVPPAEAFKVLNTLLWDKIVLAIAANNKALVSRYVAALVAGECLSAATAAKVGAALSGSAPDPTWQARIMVPACQIAGFDSLTIDDVEIATYIEPVVVEPIVEPPVVEPIVEEPPVVEPVVEEPPVVEETT